ncbi:MAG TPA: C13 family peptidase [Rhizomicrobium sp.]|jgi:hypothetical protein|nr:C13 family peptidase [Rhizomicrobium sp.]
MRLFVLCFGILLGLAQAAAAADFSHWAVLIVAGDDHAHSGAHSMVFDNARRDLAKAFAGIGFNPANMVQFSVDQPDAQHSNPSAIADALWDLTNRAPAGCLIYFTSHGSPDGIVVDDTQISPPKMAAIIGNACGSKPSVIVMSACFSGIFVPALAAPNRLVFSAARPDRTSFGCGESDHYTFFDTCFLQSLPGSSDFPDLAHTVQACVAQREKEERVDYPSEPQLFVGPEVAASLRWR